MSMETAPVATSPIGRVAADSWTLQWTPVIAGALTAAAVSSILISFAMTVGLGVSSTAPTWRDASVALWLLSGLYLVLQALVSFGCGGYVAGRVRAPYGLAESDETEKRDGLHGVAAWALAVVLGTVLAAMVASAASRPNPVSAPQTANEPSVLSYELDHLFRAAKRTPSPELAPARSEAGRILLTASSHSGVSTDDRNYLVQLVGVTTGLAGPDAERRVDTTIANAKSALSRSRASTTILAFSVATALLLGAIAAWLAAESGGRHRDGKPVSGWMLHANRFSRRRDMLRRPVSMPE
ncbi:hypothetical protein HL667_11645 [Bradyrhizobium sp. 83012]|uniref:Mll5186 protein n=1 Tax=Bradyrhizobium aeschynomenes TaxID=2734909 RepID=A0ABX2CDE0_9BRAD|nr:hypothetical protein [Bradyrhizobium aeschynomenes]NPU65650.1 hypothetical protein [Bradyrhizobium aeschynomenes]